MAEPETVLEDLYDVLGTFVVMPSEAFHVATVLWIAATHALTAFEMAPRLVVSSPEKRCGKSRLLDVITHTCHDPLATMNATTAAVFRSIDGEHPPTLIIDEADTIFGSKKLAEQHEDLRALLNAGFQRGRCALRCVGPNQTPTQFATFAMAAIGGIGTMPDTITDRGICGSMRRRTATEKVSSFRSRRDGPTLWAIRDRLAAWASSHLADLRAAEPDMPVDDRAADTWEPLIAIADIYGGDWPQRARDACRTLVTEADANNDEAALGTKLLADIRDIFGERSTVFLPTADLITALKNRDESPWAEFDFTPNKLSRRLKDYGVRSSRDTTGKVRGYRHTDFAEVFTRYLADTTSETVKPSETSPEQPKRLDGSQPSDTSKCQTDLSVRHENPDQNPFLTDLTHRDGSPPKNNTNTNTSPPPHHATGFVPPAGPGRCTTCGHHTPTQGHANNCTATTTPTTPTEQGHQ